MLQLEGSCHCGAVRFSVQTHTPIPYMHCYCSICRKTTGGGGSAINIMGEANTLTVSGEEHLSVYQAMRDGASSAARRHFCRHCGTALFISDTRWPQWVYPQASAIDSELPEVPDRAHIMLGSKASWVRVPRGPGEKHFEGYPDLSIEDWHRSQGVYVE